MSDKLKQINEEGEGGAVGTTTSSVLGTPGSPTYGGYIGPLGRISRRQLGTRLFSTWGENGVKNSTGVGKVVQPPQGYLKEHIYSLEGKMVTEQDLNEWFGADLSKKPSWNGGKLVTIEPKCLAFPYCSQGSVDNPVKLIGENKDGMCQHCYEYVSYIAKETKKTPETIAKIIREKYLSNMEPLDESIELYNQSDNNIEENKLKGGKGDNLKKSDVNRKEFNMGMEIEKEHTKNTEARKEIVLDHLAEDPKYYTHLKSMEKKNNIKETKINMEKPIIITKQTIIEMVTPKTSSVNEMRSAMQAMMENEETANCLYEVLSMEGFLPNDLSEGEDYGTHCSTLMEDDDILSEM
jgi:hypothetical protein